MTRRWIAGPSPLSLAVIPQSVGAQTRLPVVGFLRSTAAAPFKHLVVAFRQGLAEAGFVEGRNVSVDYRWADDPSSGCHDWRTTS